MDVRMRTGREGGSLLAVTLLVFSTAALSAALLTVVNSSTREQRGSQEALRALYVCEAALSEAVFDLSKGGTGDLGSKQAPLQFGNTGSYFVDATDLGNGCTALTATGRDRSVARVEAVVRALPGTAFRWAAFGDEVLEMASNARVDSYDSTQGDYLSQQVNGSGQGAYANTDGNVGSNDDVTLSQNATVWGDARPGPSGQTTLIGNNTSVSGSTLPLPAPQVLPPLTIPSGTSSGDVTVVGAGTLGSLVHHFVNFVLGTGSTMTITGPATLVVGNMELESNSSLLVDGSAGPVEIYVLDDFVVSSNTLVSSLTYSPLDIQIMLQSDNIINPNLTVDLDVVNLNSGAQLYGTIYAPNASIEINSNFELFGGIISKRLRLDSNSRIHYDEALLTAGANAAGAYETLCWRLLGAD